MKAQFILGLLVTYGFSRLFTANLIGIYPDVFYWLDTDADMQTLMWVINHAAPFILIILFLMADYNKKPSETVKIRINDVNRVRI